MISDLAAWTPSEPPRLTRPDLKVILGEAPAPGWLVRRFTEYSPDTADFYVLVSAIASIGRLWSPERGGITGHLDALLRGQDPQSRADRWFRDLPEDAHAATLKYALLEVTRLRTLLNAKGPDPVEDWDDDEVTEWLEDRDDLAAVRALTRNLALNTRADLDTELHALDVSAQAVLGARVRNLPSTKLRAVAWQYPSAWWGKVYG